MPEPAWAGGALPAGLGLPFSPLGGQERADAPAFSGEGRGEKGEWIGGRFRGSSAFSIQHSPRPLTPHPWSLAPGPSPYRQPHTSRADGAPSLPPGAAPRSRSAETYRPWSTAQEYRHAPVLTGMYLPECFSQRYAVSAL